MVITCISSIAVEWAREARSLTGQWVYKTNYKFESKIIDIEIQVQVDVPTVLADISLIDLACGTLFATPITNIAGITKAHKITLTRAHSNIVFVESINW